MYLASLSPTTAGDTDPLMYHKLKTRHNYDRFNTQMYTIDVTHLT